MSALGTLPELGRRMAQAPEAQAALRALQEARDAILGQQEEVLFPAIRNCEEAADTSGRLPTHAASAIHDLIPSYQLLSLGSRKQTY